MTLPLEPLLPAINYRIDYSGELLRFINEVLQPVLDLLCEEAERWIDQKNLNTANDDTVNAALQDVGSPYTLIYSQPLNRKRLLAKGLVRIYKEHGTVQSIIDVVRAITGLEIVNVIVPAVITGWILNYSHLGDSPPATAPDPTDFAVLGPSPSYIKYSFSVEFGVVLTSEQREEVREIIKICKPAHTHLVDIIDPSSAMTFDHWEMNFSALHDGSSPTQGDEIDLHL